MDKPRCQHIFTKRAKLAGEQCPRNGLHNGYCSRHKKKPIRQVDLSADPIFAQAPASSDGVKYRFSSFKITINSQEDYYNMSAERKQEFKDFVEFIFNEENLPEFLSDQTNKDPSVNIAGLELKHHFEVGGKFHKLHAHGIIELKHTGFYRIQTRLVNDLAKKIFGKAIHLDIRASGNSKLAWEQYIAKSANAIEI